MLRSTDDLKHYTIRATDGAIGHVKDFYFDDEAWVIRYLVVDTGTWLSSRKVLISPIAIGEINWAEKVLPVSITKDQVKNSPDIGTDKPVSRQHERRYLGYYGYPYYWGGGGSWGDGFYPDTLFPDYDGVVLAPCVTMVVGMPRRRSGVPIQPVLWTANKRQMGRECRIPVARALRGAFDPTHFPEMAKRG